MYQKIDLGPYIWNQIPGRAILEVSDTLPKDGLAGMKTVKQLKEYAQQLGGQLIDRITGTPYTLDLTNLEDDTQLWISWMHVADQPIPLTDPRHPNNYQGPLEDLIV